jgi:hypothetical protein
MTEKTLYHYRVALSDKVFDHCAKDDVTALRQIRAMCRVWKDTLLEVYCYTLRRRYMGVGSYKHIVFIR